MITLLMAMCVCKTIQSLVSGMNTLPVAYGAITTLNRSGFSINVWYIVGQTGQVKVSTPAAIVLQC